MWQLISRHRATIFFACCCVWIAAVSAHDAVLVVVHHEVMQQCERNLVGHWLIEHYQGDVWVFVWLKLVGTATACTLLVALYRWRAATALAVAAAVAGFQLLLLCYLHGA